MVLLYVIIVCYYATVCYCMLLYVIIVCYYATVCYCMLLYVIIVCYCILYVIVCYFTLLGSSAWMRDSSNQKKLVTAKRRMVLSGPTSKLVEGVLFATYSRPTPCSKKNRNTSVNVVDMHRLA
jgi:hypothetical protein